MRDYHVTIAIKVQYGPQIFSAPDEQAALQAMRDQLTELFGAVGYELEGFHVRWTDADGKERFFGRMR